MTVIQLIKRLFELDIPLDAEVEFKNGKLIATMYGSGDAECYVIE